MTDKIGHLFLYILTSLKVTVPMKKLSILFLFVLVVSQVNAKNKLSDVAKFADLNKAIELLTTEDEFTNSWSQFDIDARLNKTNGNKARLFSVISNETREWSTEEKRKLNVLFQDIDTKIKQQGLNLDLPEEIYFVSTTGEEEGGALGYTRGKYIVLNQNILKNSKAEIQHTVVHELFHLISRNNRTFRKKMYEIIHFNLTNKIEYPETLKELKITNPDAPQNDSFIRLNVDNETVDCMMVLYAKSNYQGGNFFQYLNVGLMKLEGDHHKKPTIKKGNPVIFTLNEAPDFFSKIGANTEYIIHPEEILAENFAHTILGKENLKSPEIIDKITLLLQ